MKITFILTMALLVNLCAGAQNIGIGTETPLGKLHIKGSADASQLIIDANATQSPNRPLILLRKPAGDELMRIHADNNYNVFIGNAAGSVNTTGKFNTVLGLSAFSVNTTGESNTAIGYQSLGRNTDGYYNTAIGGLTLISNSTGSENTALGYNSLINNQTGNFNTALGFQVMTSTNTGEYNTALGAGAMGLNFGGSNNTGIGVGTLSNTKNAQYNTALGYNAGGSFDNGYNNVFLGANTDVNHAGYFNVIAIGQSTVCTASSQVTMGNGATNSYRAYANWSNISDGRFKKNIQENVPGLAFITQLRPVTYNLNATGLDDFLHSNQNDVSAMTAGSERTAAPVANETAKAAITKALKEKEQVTQTGFVAQEVEVTAQKMGFNFSGIDAPANDKDVYGLRYAEFVVPLVKAVQEQQQQIESLKKDIQAQKDTNALLQKQINELKALIKK